MIQKKCTTTAVAKSALHKMQAQGRRLPWGAAEKILAKLAVTAD
jgi:hypothetical protein